MQKEYTTKNGIKVHSFEQKYLHSFCLSLNLKAGIMYEKENENGITHLLEHMFFRKFNNMSQAEFYKELDKYDFSFYGTTYKEFLRFEIRGNAKFINKAIQLFTQLLAPLNISSKDLSLDSSDGMNWKMSNVICNKSAEFELIRQSYKDAELKRLFEVAKEIFSKQNLIVTIKAAKKIKEEINQDILADF